MADSALSPASAAQAERIATAPMPTTATLRRRQNVLVQAGRFVRINLRMLRVIFAEHS
ncbi:MAG: hypothetical protein FWH11_00925 [Micrococcales bacterium]|nr:hypothetical protein [Micrococcales bacterium]